MVLFDNSSNHGCFAPDALTTSNINLSDGGRSNKFKLRDIIWTDVNGIINNQEAQMSNGDQKWVNRILEENGLDTRDMLLSHMKERLDFFPQKAWLSEIF